MIHESTARSRALERLGRVDPVEYEKSRNHLDGAVTGLSPFLRHGVLSLAEVRDAVVAKVGGAVRCKKLIQELAWRDYYQRLWHLLADRIWLDIEPYKTGFDASDYAEVLPANLLNATTGIDYIDHFVEQLHSTGHLHNHARMWLAAYTVHGLRVKWQAGARWFLSHLLDGDEASNNLSWQWCASTFSHKPYFFNRDNVLKYSGKRFAEHQANDPFDTDYQTLSRKLFGDAGKVTDPQRRFDLHTNAELETSALSAGAVDVANTLVWIHDGMMSPVHPAIARGKHHVFVWDDRHIAECNHSAGRISFQQSALFCPDVHSQGRPLAEVLHDIARERGCGAIVTGQTSDPRLRGVIDQLRSRIDVQVVLERAFVQLHGRLDLNRFSRYWAKAETRLIAGDSDAKRI
jgi:deoxyribodipyrimidine photo-lyase